MDKKTCEEIPRDTKRYQREYGVRNTEYGIRNPRNPKNIKDTSMNGFKHGRKEKKKAEPHTFPCTATRKSYWLSYLPSSSFLFPVDLVTLVDSNDSSE